MWTQNQLFMVLRLKSGFNFWCGNSIKICIVLSEMPIELLSHILSYLLIRSLHHFIQNINLASLITYIVCVNFIYDIRSKNSDYFHWALSISDNSYGSSTSVFSSINVQKWPKTLFLGISTPYVLKTFRVESAKYLRKHLDPSYLQNPCRTV